MSASKQSIPKRNDIEVKKKQQFEQALINLRHTFHGFFKNKKSGDLTKVEQEAKINNFPNEQVIRGVTLGIDSINNEKPIRLKKPKYKRINKHESMNVQITRIPTVKYTRHSSQMDSGRLLIKEYIETDFKHTSQTASQGNINQVPEIKVYDVPKEKNSVLPKEFVLNFPNENEQKEKQKKTRNRAVSSYDCRESLSKPRLRPRVEEPSYGPNFTNAFSTYNPLIPGMGTQFIPFELSKPEITITLQPIDDDQKNAKYKTSKYPKMKIPDELKKNLNKTPSKRFNDIFWDYKNNTVNEKGKLVSPQHDRSPHPKPASRLFHTKSRSMKTRTTEYKGMKAQEEQKYFIYFLY